LSINSPALKAAFDAGIGSSTLEIQNLFLAPRLFPCTGPRATHAKAAPKCHWGNRMLKRLVSSARTRSKKKRISPGQQRLPWDWDVRLNQIPEDWYQIGM